MKKIVIPTTAKGCSLGVRELDPHLEILQSLGAARACDGSLTLTLDGQFRAACRSPPRRILSWPRCSQTANRP
jgi:UDP-N-acetylglucosamine 1-carboxyvinyltransferase